MTRVLTEEQKRRNRERARQWALDNPERYKAKQAEHYRKNAERLRERARDRRAEKIDEVRAYDRARAARSKPQKREYDQAYRMTNAARISEGKIRWRQTPEGRASTNANSARRRAKLKNLDCGCVTKEALHAIWERDKGLCYACGDTGGAFDHVEPLAVRGPHCVSNLRVICSSCNSTKSHRPLDYLLDRLKDRGVEISPRLQLPQLPCPAKETR